MRGKVVQIKDNFEPIEVWVQYEGENWTIKLSKISYEKYKEHGLKKGSIITLGDKCAPILSIDAWRETVDCCHDCKHMMYGAFESNCELDWKVVKDSNVCGEFDKKGKL
jgi:hypothetical protein